VPHLGVDVGKMRVVMGAGWQTRGGPLASPCLAFQPRRLLLMTVAVTISRTYDFSGSGGQ
jgi:hypothetical protein